MKKQGIAVLLGISLLFFAFTMGFFCGRNTRTPPIAIEVPLELLVPETQPTTEAETKAEEPEISFPLDINLATEDALQALPGIGQVLAERIVSYRETHGGFQSLAELSLVEGIGEGKLTKILPLVCIGGES